MNKLRKAGTLYKKSFNKWERYFGLLHGSYLYLFNDHIDDTLVKSIYLRGTEITRLDP
jgi:hypothetical protein